MTPQLQFFMILGAVALLLIIFLFLKRGLMSVKYSLLWLAQVQPAVAGTGRGAGGVCAVPLCCVCAA